MIQKITMRDVCDVLVEHNFRKDRTWKKNALRSNKILYSST